jgi:hypothetical protein
VFPQTTNKAPMWVCSQGQRDGDEGERVDLFHRENSCQE